MNPIKSKIEEEIEVEKMKATVSNKYSLPALSSSSDVYFGVAAESFRSLRDES